MPRIKIDLPEKFSFVTRIAVRITDLNYGGHVGNDNVLSIMHEARVQFLRSKGYDELNLAGVGLIMRDVAIEFKDELFYGEDIKAAVVAGEFSRVGFDIFYKLEKEDQGKTIIAVRARTGMICYHYGSRKIVSLPEEARTKLADGI